MAHDFAPVRPAAQHCAELLNRGPRPEERAAMVAAWRRDLARTLADELSPLLSGDRLEVSILEPEALTGAEALRRIGEVAANSLLRCGASGETALLSFDFATALALTDRSFGGEGRITGGIPDALPRSAALMVDEAAARIAAALTRVSYGDTPPPTPSRSEGAVIIRSESAARLKPFGLESACVLVPIVIANRQGCEWRASLAMAAERLDRLLPDSGRRAAPRGPRPPASGLAAPFAGIPLPLHVVVAEFELSLSRLNSLNPGDSIPITMGRQVPLMIGETVLAHGNIGTAEDHMAIRLTRFPLPAVAQGFAR
jgi:flagellar motor switch/type III secretory pathway protein FliN